MSTYTYTTTSEAEIRACTARGLNVQQIASELNVSCSMLRSTLSVLGIALNRKPATQASPIESVWEEGTYRKPSRAAFAAANPFSKAPHA